MLKNAFAKLSEQTRAKKTQIILGLDYDETWDELMKDKALDLESFIKDLIDRLAPYIVGIKPNLAFYEHSAEFRTALGNVMRWTAKSHPELVRILDVKRGDIANTQKGWADADLANFDPDIVTINPYMGWKDTIAPYLDLGIDVFALAATSNADTEIQNLNSEGLRMYQHMALSVRNAGQDRVGLVVGATKPAAIRNIRAAELEHGIAPAWVLAPGFGRQGGDLSFVKYAGPNTVYPISSGLVNPKYLNDLTPAQAAEHWRDMINAAGADYDLKSVSQMLVDGLIDKGLMWIAPSADEKTWKKLAKPKADGTPNFSPIYWKIRDIQSHPDLLRWAAHLMAKKLKEAGIGDGDAIGAVPYGALSLAYAVAEILGLPVVTVRKEAKGDEEFVGETKAGQKIWIVEDVATSGGSTLDTAQKLRAGGFVVEDAIVLIDREATAKENLTAEKIRLHSVTTQKEAVGTKMDKKHPMFQTVWDYINAK